MIKFISLILLCVLLFSACSFKAADKITDQTDNESTGNTDNTVESADKGASNEDQNTPASPDIENSKPSDDPLYPSNNSTIELLELLELIENDSQDNKIDFKIHDKDTYDKYKDVDLGDDIRWLEAEFTVKIHFVYEYAAEEPWYRNSSTSNKSRNKAFYDHYNYLVQNCESFSADSNLPELWLTYDSAEDMYADYFNIKLIEKFQYIESIVIDYYYSVPVFPE